MLDAVFWGCLVASRDVDELNGSTIRYLIDLPGHRSPDYVAGVLVKYITDVRHPMAFLKAVFAKEPDPLAQTEIKKGQEAIDAGAELMRNISRLEELGLSGIRNFTRAFPILESEMGKTLESVKAALEALQGKRSKFMETWGSEASE